MSIIMNWAQQMEDAIVETLPVGDLRTEMIGYLRDNKPKRFWDRAIELDLAAPWVQEEARTYYGSTRTWQGSDYQRPTYQWSTTEFTATLDFSPVHISNDAA